MDASLEHMSQLALNQFVTALCENRDHEWNPAHGTPPSRAYVEQKEFATRPWTAKTTIAAWTIEDYDVVTEIKPLTKWNTPTVSGMFFDCLIGYWGISNELQQVSINWQIGPRFGRVFVHRILESPTGMQYLGDPKPTWIS